MNCQIVKLSNCKFLYVLLIAVLSVGCKQRVSSVSQDAGDTLMMKYAENLTIVRTDHYTKVELLDPWHKGKLLHTYLLVSNGQSVPDDIDATATIVSVPLKRSVVFNTAHASLIQMLGALDAVVGVADLKYMLLPEVQRRVAQSSGNAIADCGDSMNPDSERIVDLQADAILLSPFENSGGYGKLEQIGVPIVECADYMETSALGRAEWMRFYGLLYGKEHEADSLFAVVERSYLSQKAEAERLGHGMTILTERLTGSTWYVPGGRSSMGRLLADAGARYAWADDGHSGSLPLSLEAVIDKAGDADIWVMNHSAAHPLTYAELASMHHSYATIGAFQKRNVYFVNSLETPYFEEVTFRPDFLLHDYITILHPSMAGRELRYLRRVETSP